MPAPTPDPVAAVAFLAQGRIIDDANLRSALGRVATVAATLVPNCVAASVTLVERGRAITAGASNELANTVDRAQYDANDGPCLAAARENRSIVIDEIAADSRWPEFARVAEEHGLRSTLSVPLGLTGDDTVGGVNLHSKVIAAFGEEEQHLCESFAGQASIVVANVQAYWAALFQSIHLSAALESRPTIEQAKGILMGRHRISADDAFDLLRRQSQAENRKLRAVAEEIVRQTVESADD